jgi:hypothetical protein
MALALPMALPTSAASEPTGSGGLSDPASMTVITTVGDDLFSTADMATLLDPAGTNSTQHYGPYASGSTDSGTCGNNWANDTFDRHFTVHNNHDGTFTVTEQFKDGTFVTPASDSPVVNFSPGACQASATPASAVNPGVTGSLHGYFVIPMMAGTIQTSTSPFCNATTMSNANCDTTTFINTHFSCIYTTPGCAVTTFFFHYSAGDQGLIYHEWKNASADRSGNSGDIRSTNI